MLSGTVVTLWISLFLFVCCRGVLSHSGSVFSCSFFVPVWVGIYFFASVCVFLEIELELSFLETF